MEICLLKYLCLKEEYVHSKYEYEVDRIIRFHPQATSSEELTLL
jgi:hypothetical protein